jgi:SNF2 family DNA or RNA helicase
VVKIVGYKNMQELQQRVDAYALRLRSADCLDLPERTYQVLPIQMTTEQKKVYDEMRKDALAEVEGGVVVAEVAVVKLIRLQQILCGHVKDEDEVVHTLPQNRVEACADVMRNVDGKVIIWARFHHDIDLLVAALKEYNPVTWDGRTSTDERQMAKDRFIHDEECRLFIANPSAAGTGVDGLQHVSHTMIYYSNSFKASDRWQSEARLHRDGQKGTVNIIDLVVPNSLDGYILKALKHKKDVATAMVDIREALEEQGELL